MQPLQHVASQCMVHTSSAQKMSHFYLNHLKREIASLFTSGHSCYKLLSLFSMLSPDDWEIINISYISLKHVQSVHLHCESPAKKHISTTVIKHE